MPKGPQNTKWKPSEEQRARATELGRKNKEREQAAEESMEKHVAEMMLENARRIREKSQKGRSRRTMKASRRRRGTRRA